MRLLVTGGAGYIGSVVAAQLADERPRRRRSWTTCPPGTRTRCPPRRDVPPRHDPGRRRRPCSAPASTRCCTSRPSRWSASRSRTRPGTGSNNLGGTLALLEAMRVTGTRRIVFSSTAAVYGEPERIPIAETAPVRPTSPYGASKVAVDTALAEYARMHQIGAVSLRYFNVAGAYADAAGTWRGERHAPETHLIPTVLAGGPAPARRVSHLRRRLPDPGRDLHQGLHPRVGPGPRARAGPGRHRSRRAPRVQPRQRDRVLQPRGARRLPGGDRARRSRRRWRPAARRPGGPGRLVRGASPRTSAGGAERDLRAMVADAWTFAAARTAPGPVTAR